MPLTDVLSAALSRPAGRVVERPVRELVEQILSDKGFLGPKDKRVLEGEISALREQLGKLEARVTAAEGVAAVLRQERGELDKQIEAAATRAHAAERRAEAAESALASAVQTADDAVKSAEQAIEAAAAAQTRAKSADDRAKVALNRSRLALSDTGPASPTEPEAASSNRVGPNGEVSVDGVLYRVDASHAGAEYEVRGTRTRRVRIDGRFVRKSKA